jgi:rubrerythrin
LGKKLMKGYVVSVWYCKACRWSWKTLTRNIDAEDQCPECSSYETQRIIKKEDLDYLN